MWSLAECWWRQHIRAKRAGTLRKIVAQGEICGKKLWEYVVSVEDLHELFFSTVILHWNLHAPLPQSQRLTVSEWMDMHCVGGIQIVPHAVLGPLYEVLARAPIDQLLLVPSPGEEQLDLPSGITVRCRGDIGGLGIGSWRRITDGLRRIATTSTAWP